MDSKNNNYDDFISFIDDDEVKKDIFVKILKVDNTWVTFEMKSGNTIIIPSNRVQKIKLKGGLNV